MTDLSEYLKEKVKTVALYASSSTDWLEIKRQILNSVDNYNRGLFSQRHSLTKLQELNDHDMAVMNFWKEITGIQLTVSDFKLQPVDWIHKPRGWAIVKRKSHDKNNKT